MNKNEAVTILQALRGGLANIGIEDADAIPQVRALGIAIQAMQYVDVWDGIHGQVVAPSGTFEQIFADADDCASCILDCTDACIRGAGRAVDSSICEAYIGQDDAMREVEG